MGPNYKFDAEISEMYGIAARDYRIVAEKLLNKYKIINKKEFSVIMWIACNLSAGSLLRQKTLANLKEMELKEIVKRNNKKQINLNF